ncbi:MAG: rRNA maturation RNase YbeY [Lachnospiraceae bacterium]|nr:rRNA maturation RNase YbeY [Lachnospiraceae bacterium]
MTVNTELEKENIFDFDYEALFERIVNTVIEAKNCPYDVSVDLLITGDDEIREINLSQRGIDRATDVLSFPMVDFDHPCDFDGINETDDVFDPDSGELILGDIVLSIDRITLQAEEYGHSLKREYAFLIVHSMLHLFGYDHLEEEDRILMEQEQKKIMKLLDIGRDQV